MSRFISKNSKKIELDNKEWVEVRENVSFLELQPLLEGINKEDDIKNIKLALPILELGLTNWNFKDSDDKEVEFSKDKIKDLDTSTIIELVQILIGLYFPQKKSLEKSNE